MKKNLFSVLFVTCLISSASAVPTITKQPLSNRASTMIVPSFNGTITWSGNQGYVIFSYSGAPYLQFRQVERQFTSISTTGSTITITIDKAGWISYGSLSSFSISAFNGNNYWGEFNLTVPTP